MAEGWMPENAIKLTNEIEAGKLTAKEAYEKLKSSWLMIIMK